MFKMKPITQKEVPNMLARDWHCPLNVRECFSLCTCNYRRSTMFCREWLPGECNIWTLHSKVSYFVIYPTNRNHNSFRSEWMIVSIVIKMSIYNHQLVQQTATKVQQKRAEVQKQAEKKQRTKNKEQVCWRKPTLRRLSMELMESWVICSSWNSSTWRNKSSWNQLKVASGKATLEHLNFLISPDQPYWRSGDTAADGSSENGFPIFVSVLRLNRWLINNSETTN